MSRTHHLPSNVPVTRTIPLDQTILRIRHLVSRLISTLLRLPQRLCTLRLRNRTFVLALHDLHLLDLRIPLSTTRQTSSPKNMFLCCSGYSIMSSVKLLLALLALWPTWIASYGIWRKPTALDANMRDVRQGLSGLTGSIFRFFSMTMSPHLILVVLNPSVSFLFLTNCAEAILWGQDLLNTFKTVIVVFSNVHKLIMSYHCLTALLPLFLLPYAFYLRRYNIPMAKHGPRVHHRDWTQLR